MHLRRIEVRDFRKITHRVIDGLDSGLNVIVGDNEAGKSTLLSALRTVFFERHTLGGKPVEAMLPYGANVRPEVVVDFEIDGAPWRLRKAFNQRPEAELTGPGERHLGTAVEDRLAGLLGFTPPGRGASKSEEHHGTHGLLWVEQGTRERLGVGAARDTLASALEREVGQVTGGDRGRALLAAAELRRAEFWTKADKPRGSFKDLRDAIDRLEAERDVLRARQQVHDGKITRLTELTGILARHTRDDRLNRATAAAGAAKAALAAAQALDGALTMAAARRIEAERERASAAERRARRIALVDSLAAARQATEAAETEAADAQAVVGGRDAQAGAAEARLQAARREYQAAEARVRTMEEVLARRQIESVLTRQAEQLRLAETQDRQRRDAVARSEAIAVDRDTIVALAKLEKTAEAARAELGAASVQIGFEPEGTRSVVLDGVPHAAETTLALTRDAVLTLEGFGRLVIRPGGGTADLARRAEAAERALQEALGRVRLVSLAEARVALDVRTQAQAEAASLAQSLAGLAPQGIEALRQSLETERTRLAKPLGPEAAALGDVDPAQLEQARRDQAVRRATIEAAEQDDRQTGTARQEAMLAAARLTERSAAARRQRQAVADELERARRDCDDDRLNAQVRTAEAASEAAIAAERAARHALDAADPDAAVLALDRAETAERAIRADIETLDRERRDLLAELRGSGQDGIGERLGEIEGQLETHRRQFAARTVEADASRLLHDTLLAAQREAKDRWLGPVRARVSPYLKLMEPGAEIVMNEHTLEIDGILRNGVTEPFDALSMGAREQVAVITRLALADVLRAAGHPAAIILDDALVNTDEIRLDRMHNVLTRAARSLQVLILTCRERDFLGLGKVHRI